jgi:hypothetical protein
MAASLEFKEVSIAYHCNFLLKAFVFYIQDDVCDYLKCIIASAEGEMVWNVKLYLSFAFASNFTQHMSAHYSILLHSQEKGDFEFL